MTQSSATTDGRDRASRVSSALLAAALIVTACLAGGGAAAQEDIEDARDQRDRARAEQAAAAEQLELLEAEDAEVAAALSDMQLALENQAAKVEAARQYVAAAEAEAARRRAEVEATEAEIELARDRARRQAVEAFIGVAVHDTDLWLTDRDPSETARKLALLRVSSDNSADAIDELRALELNQQVLVERAAESEAAAEEARRALEAELAEQQRRVDTQVAVRGELQGRIDDWEAEVAAFEQEEAELTEFIKEQQRLAIGTTDHTPGPESLEGFIKPVAGDVGSLFGPRVHPIYGTTRMHNGVDMGGSMGDPIWAAKDGVVIDAGWNGGYGNAVVIDHGDGVTTLYAHQSELFVSEGTSVGQGETIGAVGSTGLSTGPHLHFEVRINGEPEDPLFFLP